MSETFCVMNGIVPVEFQGTFLGEATTERPSSLRWTELKIYRTDGGNYVLVKLGKSVVYHALDSGCSETAIRISGNEIPDSSVSCEVCDPPEPEDYDFDSGDEFEHERNFSKVTVVDGPSKLQEALSSYDKKRRDRGPSPVAIEALNKAAGRDPKLLNLILSPIRIP